MANIIKTDLLDQFSTLPKVDRRSKPKKIIGSRESLIAKIEAQIDSLQEDLANTAEALQIANSLKFTRGDVVYHTTHGACIVQSIDFNSFGASIAEFCKASLLVNIAHKDGLDQVPATELVLKTPMAETIYGE